MADLYMKNGESALVVVAHPDDETIWLGGVIASYPKIKWTIFSLCRANDADRAPKFFTVCDFFSAQGIIEDLEDEGMMTIKKSVPVIEKILIKKLNNKKFDHIFTHGSNGEYGHIRHKGVHRAVKNLYKTKRIEGKELLFFNYRKKSNQQYSTLIEKSDSDYIIRLNDNLFNKKIEAMTKIYGFNPKGIDTAYCTNPEALKRYRD